MRDRSRLPAVWVAAVLVLSFPAWSAESDMVSVPGGSFLPLFKDTRPPTGSAAKIPVDQPLQIAPFQLDTYPVTNGQFLQFVKRNPKWSRSRVKRIFADGSYLKHWKSDFVVAPGQREDAPVVNVSWFAARAYCKWKERRLPMVAEWEYAASIAPGDEKAEEEAGKKIAAWFAEPTPKAMGPVGATFKNRFGSWDLHALIWEWTEDFNSSFVMEDARGDAAGDKGLFCGAGASGSRDFRNYAGFMRYAFRSSLRGDYTVANLGFRCAK